MKQNTFIVANWKMNLNFDSANNLIKSIKDKINKKKTNITTIICPQFLLIPHISRYFENENLNFFLGSQDIHHENSGAFTGDSSIELVKYFGCKYSIIGHSERRKNHFEEDLIIKKKVILASKNSLIPILCVGESFEDRKNKKYLDVISSQLKNVIPNDLKTIIVAYEPIWSIGTGLIPNNSQIEEVASHIKNFLIHNNIQKFNILYGGSVNPENSHEIFKLENINGGLIGGASVKKEQFIKILSKFYLD